MQNEILTVSELNSKAHSLLQREMGSFWITGEISNFTVPRSGHWYFSLKDTKAQIRCAMFVQANKLVKFIPKDGTKVNILAKASIYGARGDFQLIVSAMVDDGIGKLQKEFELLIKKLSTEGLFDKEHKRPLPAIPKCIGIITSATGAALHDILNVLNRRNTLSPIKLYPSMVQGANAYLELINAIEECESDGECDVIILARGGGSIEDLWAFNNEQLARRIFECEIPIITGVGHETDFTIADYISDYRAPTPSAAAEIVCIDSNQLLERLYSAKVSIINSIISKIDKLESRLNFAKAKLPDPINQLNVLHEKTYAYKLLLIKAIKNNIQTKEHYFKVLSSNLHTLSPLATLGRGYSITINQQTQKPVTQVQSISPGSSIKVIVHQGEIFATVNSVKEVKTSKEDI